MGPHAEQLAQFGDRPGAPVARTLPEPIPRPSPGPSPGPIPPAPDVTVYGYWPYWGESLSTIPFHRITHLALFQVTLDSDGGLSDTDHWTDYVGTALSLAEPYGVRIHLCVTCFDSDVMSAVFSSAQRRERAISEMVALVEDYGAHGVNIDVEGLPSSLKSEFTAFISDLNQRVDDLYLATPAVDWSAAYDYDQLALHSDGLFIMGYAYHYSSGDPGPVGPLYGGDPWSDYCLEWTVEDYRDNGAPDDRLVLGLPLYGYEWPTTGTDVPGTATGDGTAVFFTEAVADGEQYGRQWDSVTHTPYAFPTGTSQLWYDDTESLEDRIAYAVGEGLAGIGFWALTYEEGDAGFWDMVASWTGSEDPGDSGDPSTDTGDVPADEVPVADAGEARVASVGDRVTLDGSGSYDPEGGALTYGWSQVFGPEVELSGSDSSAPSFLAERRGRHTFELVVASATATSEPDTVDVVVDDPNACGADADCSAGGCSCTAIPGSRGAGLLILLVTGGLAMGRRRR